MPLCIWHTPHKHCVWHNRTGFVVWFQFRIRMRFIFIIYTHTLFVYFVYYLLHGLPPFVSLPSASAIAVNAADAVTACHYLILSLSFFYFNTNIYIWYYFVGPVRSPCLPLSPSLSLTLSPSRNFSCSFFSLFSFIYHTNPIHIIETFFLMKKGRSLIICAVFARSLARAHSRSSTVCVLSNERIRFSLLSVLVLFSPRVVVVFCYFAGKYLKFYWQLSKCLDNNIQFVIYEPLRVHTNTHIQAQA